MILIKVNFSQDVSVLCRYPHHVVAVVFRPSTIKVLCLKWNTLKEERERTLSGVVSSLQCIASLLHSPSFSSSNVPWYLAFKHCSLRHRSYNHSPVSSPYSLHPNFHWSIFSQSSLLLSFCSKHFTLVLAAHWIIVSRVFRKISSTLEYF